MLHYDNDNFISLPKTYSHFCSTWGDREDYLPNSDSFTTAIDKLMKNLSFSAAYNSESEKMFAVGEMSYPLATIGNTTIYGLAQCTRDLSANNCSACLANYTATLLSNHCQEGTHTGGAIYGESCFFWYDNKNFYNYAALSPPPMPNSANPSPSPTAQGGKGSHNSETPMLFSYKQLQAATDNFSNLNLLGKGRFGEVFTGKINGKLVAVKRFSNMENELKLEKENMLNLVKELNLLVNIRHQNIVKLVGCCFGGKDETRCTVYEYMAKGSLLDYWRNSNKRKSLNWTMRFNIIRGSAQGLSYLHNNSVKKTVHIDIKLSNILLDEDLTVKIADFDLIRTFDIDETHQTTERTCGTVKMAESLIDKDLEMPTKNEVEEMLRCIHIGLLCTQENAQDRPNMLRVVRWLDNREPLEEPGVPGYWIKDSTEPNELGTSITDSGSSLSLENPKASRPFLSLKRSKSNDGIEAGTSDSVTRFTIS
ncbi:hypothetical protein LUZ63_009084 [Rhynchospora breviuscula]|uniref:non-specific serine/threonine protein kinase n=1 Tax=Rhynchospora breviuscula TaxID=2022672 RepID=A0A9Q0CEC7_9POAL|nr:hypothetical protein LUZ63_009084 [Rhynchospora breviuscula]